MLSIASIWEMQIKVQTGKLNLHSTLPNLIANQQRVNNLQLLPIEVNHIWALADLVHHHRDPFDRILVAQAIVQKMPVLSMDEVLDSYLVERLW